MRGLPFWLALPLLAPQALYVRHTAPRFAGAAGPNEGSVGSGRRYRLLAFGDSIVAGVGARDFPAALVGQTALALSIALSARIDWTAHGFIGANSSRLLDEHLPGLTDLEADIVVTSVGVNDVTSLTTLPRWRRNVATLLLHLTAASGDALIAFAGLPPLGGFPLLPKPLRGVLGARARHLDEAAREIIAGFPGVIHVPVEFETSPDKFAPDGYHPNESSYVTFGQGMAAKIVEKLGAG